LGLETDFQGSGERGSGSFFDPYFYFSSTPNGSISGTRESTILWFGTIRGRVGALLNPTTLLYATGGLAYGRIKASGSFTDTYLGSFYNA
jgi:outer membrane immunogenic protein